MPYEKNYEEIWCKENTRIIKNNLKRRPLSLTNLIFTITTYIKAENVENLEENAQLANKDCKNTTKILLYLVNKQEKNIVNDKKR